MEFSKGMAYFLNENQELCMMKEEEILEKPVINGKKEEIKIEEKEIAAFRLSSEEGKVYVMKKKIKK